jgi:hypothetical protein
MFEICSSHVHPISQISPPGWMLMPAQTPGEEELQETVRRSDERIKGQERQIAELRERLQEAYEAHRQNATEITEITEHGAHAEQQHAEQQHAANMFFDILSYKINVPFDVDIFRTSRKTVRNRALFCFDFSRVAERVGCLELSP